MIKDLSKEREFTVIPGRCESIEPGISRFPDAQLRICGSMLRIAPE
ncbi:MULTISPECIES: hypothetical protein [unclassified Bradyrhizobium]